MRVVDLHHYAIPHWQPYGSGRKSRRTNSEINIMSCLSISTLYMKCFLLASMKSVCYPVSLMLIDNHRNMINGSICFSIVNRDLARTELTVN